MVNSWEIKDSSHPFFLDRKLLYISCEKEDIVEFQKTFPGFSGVIWKKEKNYCLYLYHVDRKAEMEMRDFIIGLKYGNAPAEDISQVETKSEDITEYEKKAPEEPSREKTEEIKKMAIESLPSLTGPVPTAEEPLKHKKNKEREKEEEKKKEEPEEKE